MHMIAIIVNKLTRMVPCYTCLDQSFPDNIAGSARSNTPDHQETTNHLHSTTKHQHTIIRATIHEANKEMKLEKYTNSSKMV
jgi:Ni,Fe-hydrogenase I small subunit